MATTLLPYMPRHFRVRLKVATLAEGLKVCEVIWAIREFAGVMRDEADAGGSTPFASEVCPPEAGFPQGIPFRGRPVFRARRSPAGVSAGRLALLHDAFEHDEDNDEPDEASQLVVHVRLPASNVVRDPNSQGQPPYP